jgi:hypothetical protein
MKWWSETSVLWLPVPNRPDPADFAERARPGASDFYYYALDAFEAIARRRPQEFDREPWAYVLSEHQILSPGEIDQLMDDWRDQIRAASAVDIVSATSGRNEPMSVQP